MLAAAGGGGDLTVDYAALGRAATELTGVGGALDATGGGAPTGGNSGDAAALIAQLLAIFADAAAIIMAETSVVASAVEVCSSGLASTDAEQAVTILTTGGG
jgi:hypothetical protein